MPRSVVKKSIQPQSFHQDPVVWGIAGAYLVGMLMVGAIATMTNLPSLKGSVNYNQSQAGYEDGQNELSGVVYGPNGTQLTPNVPTTSIGAELENVLQNGSFEDVVVRSQSKILIDGTTQLGWKVSWANSKPQQMSLIRQPGLEILSGYMGWQASNGSQFARLDTADLSARSARTQSLIALTQTVKAKAGTYYLSFDFAAQPKTAAKDNQVELKWNGDILGAVTADGANDIKPTWKNHRYRVEVTGRGDTLEVIGKGEENNQGNFVDNFVLTPVVK